MRLPLIISILLTIAHGIAHGADLERKKEVTKKKVSEGVHRRKPGERYRRRPHIHLFHLNKSHDHEGEESKAHEKHDLGHDFVRLGQDLLFLGSGHHPGHVVEDLIHIGQDIVKSELSHDVVNLGQDLFFLGHGHHPGHLLEDLRHIGHDLLHIGEQGPGLLQVKPGAKHVTTIASSSSLPEKLEKQNSSFTDLSKSVGSSVGNLLESGPVLSSNADGADSTLSTVQKQLRSNQKPDIPITAEQVVTNLKPSRDDLVNLISSATDPNLENMLPITSAGSALDESLQNSDSISSSIQSANNLENFATESEQAPISENVLSNVAIGLDEIFQKENVIEPSIILDTSDLTNSDFSADQSNLEEGQITESSSTEPPLSFNTQIEQTVQDSLDTIMLNPEMVQVLNIISDDYLELASSNQGIDFSTFFAFNKQSSLESELNTAVNQLNSLTDSLNLFYVHVSRTKLTIYVPIIEKCFSMWQTAATSIDRALLFAKFPRDILTSSHNLSTSDLNSISLNQKMSIFQLGRASGQIQGLKDFVMTLNKMVAPETVGRDLVKHGFRSLPDLAVPFLAQRAALPRLDLHELVQPNIPLPLQDQLDQLFH